MVLVVEVKWPDAIALKLVQKEFDAVARDGVPRGPPPRHSANIFKLGPWCGRSGRTPTGMFAVGEDGTAGFRGGAWGSVLFP